MPYAHPKPDIWQPSAKTKMSLDDLVVMHGGPQAMRLTEHEHSSLQIEAHFSRAVLARKSQFVVPETYHLIPSKKPHTGGWSEGSEVIVVLLDTRHIELAADELLRRSGVAIKEEIWGSDTVVQSVAGLLRREFLTGTTDPLFLEALRTTLSGHLVRTFRNAGTVRVEGRLSPRHLRAALDMIECHLESGVSVVALAERCQMGIHRFTRSFKASTGLSPYQYFIRRKMEKAKHSLQGRSQSLAEIAHQLGFSSQSHFSSVFRRLTQMTPSEYRRKHRR